MSSPDEEFARLLIMRVLGNDSVKDELHPLAITLGDLCGRPDLLRVVRDLPAESFDAVSQSGAIVYADDLSDPMRAAALVLEPAQQVATPSLEALVSVLERTQRSALLGQLVRALDDRLQRRVHAERTEALGRLATLLSAISQIVEDLFQL